MTLVPSSVLAGAVIAAALALPAAGTSPDVAIRCARGAGLATYAYDGAGNRTSAVLPNGITTTWAYDARNRLTRVEHKTTATGTVQAFYESAWNAQAFVSPRGVN